MDRSRRPVDGHGAPQEDRDDRPREDAQGGRQRRLPDVEPVERALLWQDLLEVDGHGIAAGEEPALVRERQLREPRQPWAHAQDDVKVLRASPDEDRVLGARPDEAELTGEDLPELRELVQARAREETAGERQATVAVNREWQT